MGDTSFGHIFMELNERQNTLRHCLGDLVVAAFAYMKPINIDGFPHIRKNTTNIVKCIIIMQAFSLTHNAIGLFIEVFYILLILSAIHIFLIITQYLFFKNSR